MKTRSLTPVRPSAAQRARTVLAAAASVSVSWPDGRVDLLGCHHDDPRGDVVLTLEPTSGVVRAARRAPEGGLPVQIQLTDLCPVSARERIRARMVLRGQVLAEPDRDSSTATLHVEVGEVLLSKLGLTELGRVEDVDLDPVELAAYRRAEVDPLHLAAPEQVQHLMAHHPDALVLLSRLCEPAVLQGATRVLPIALDRYGLVLRVERLRGHVDVRLAFGRSVETAGEAAEELRGLMLESHRRRPCRPLRPF